MEGVYPSVNPYSLLPLILSLFSILGALLEAIERDFGSFDIFRAEMTAKTVGIQGSGWGWLVSNCNTIIELTNFGKSINKHKPPFAVEQWTNRVCPLINTHFAPPISVGL